MQWFRLRPTFEIVLDETRDEAIEKLRQEYSRSGRNESFLMFGEYGEMHLPIAEHRLWSPHLSFYVMDHEQQSRVHGRFAPRLEVWTLLWIIYLLMTFSAFFGLVLAYSQWTIGETMWGLGVAILGATIIASIYIVAHVGQQWSSDQMQTLRNQLDRTLELAGVRCHLDSPGAS